jgi:hypothetical protein
VHTIALGHAPHFYVAGTLPEFAPTSSIFGVATSSMSYSFESVEREAPRFSPPVSYTPSYVAPAPVEATHIPEPPAPPRQPIQAAKPPAPRPHFSRSAHTRNRKPVTAARPGKPTGASRIARRAADARSANGARAGQTARWGKGAHSSANPKGNGTSVSKSHANGFHPTGNGTHSGKSSAPAWNKHNGHGTIVKATAKAAVKRSAALARKDARTDTHSVHGKPKPAFTAGAKAANAKRFDFTARAGKGTKKRG